MRCSTALVATFVAASTAFLIPPSIPNGIVEDARFREEHKNDKDLIHALLAEKTEVLDLDCPGCPYAVAHREDRDAGPVNEGITWEYEVENSIHLEFDTHDHAVQVNGHPIYPFEAALKARSTLVKASQIRKDTHERSVSVPLNFAADVRSPIRSPENDDIQLVGIDFTILGLNGIPVKVPSISIHLIKTPLDEYVITKISTTPFIKTPGAKSCESSSSWSLCRIKAILAAHIDRVLEAARHGSNKMQEWVQQKTKGCNGKGPHPPTSHKHHHHDPEEGKHDHDGPHDGQDKHHSKPHHDHDRPYDGEDKHHGRPHHSDHEDHHNGEEDRHHAKPHHDHDRPIDGEDRHHGKPHHDHDRPIDGEDRHHGKPHHPDHEGPHDGEEDKHHSKPHHGKEDNHHAKPCPHGHGGHGGHDKHHKHHRIGHMLHQMFRFFIIPATLGVIGGLAASAIGMLVGQAIVFFWVKAYRNGQRGPLRAREETVIIDEEKDELLGEYEEVLPEYSDTVTVDSTEVVTSHDEKN